jgi:hypothetical protein
MAQLGLIGPVVALAVAVLMPITVAAAAPQPPVKKSTSGICHDASSASYASTKHYQSFQSLDECLKSAGRLPRSWVRATAESPADTVTSDKPGLGGGDQDFLKEPKVWGGGLLVGAALAGLFVWRRQRRRWEGHCREGRWEGSVPEPSDAEIFKRRRHRWDPWLKRVGYFKKRD